MSTASCFERSPAIDAGDNNLAPGATDQRGIGFARIAPAGGSIDIGAFEVQQTQQPVCSLIVTTTADTDNAGDAVNSLREAINCANSDPDLSTITFNIPGAGPHTISVGSAGLGQLPDVTAPVIIDGYTQGLGTADPSDDARQNTDPNGFNGRLLIEVNGVPERACGVKGTSRIFFEQDCFAMDVRSLPKRFGFVCD